MFVIHLQHRDSRYHRKRGSVTNQWTFPVAFFPHGKLTKLEQNRCMTMTMNTKEDGDDDDHDNDNDDDEYGDDNMTLRINDDNDDVDDAVR